MALNNPLAQDEDDDEEATLIGRTDDMMAERVLDC